MVRPLATTLTAAATALAACVIPTDACGCTPSRSAVVVVGTVLDAERGPVAGARVFLDGSPRDRAPGFAQYVGEYPDATTDGGGAFRAIAYSAFSPGPMDLRVAVVRPTVGDTTRVVAGSATFRRSDQRLDTLRVTVRLP